MTLCFYGIRVANPLPLTIDSSNVNAPLWHEEIFNSSLDALVLDWPREEGLTLLRVWFYFMLFRSAAVSRPLLTLIGQPGSGKSTLLRKLYSLLYGKNKSLSSVTVSGDFDHAVSTNPLVVFDNVDTYERWLPDRLALSAGTSDITKRKLYTDTDTVVMKRHALVALTSHNPKFVREDVADRLLMLNFQRRTFFTAEGTIMEEISRNRNSFWTQIAMEIQNILKQPQPQPNEYPQFRIEDFAKLGLWIAKGLNIENVFLSAIHRLKGDQTKFVLEEEALLVESIYNLLEKEESIPYTLVGMLFENLKEVSPDPRKFEYRYKNSTQLGKKLWSLQDSLRNIFDCNVKTDTHKRSRVWSFSKRKR